MKRRDFLRSTGTFGAIAVSAPAFAMNKLWEPGRNLLIVVGSARCEDMIEHFSPLARKFDTASVTPPASHYEAFNSMCGMLYIHRWIINGQAYHTQYLSQQAFEQAIDCTYSG